MPAPLEEDEQIALFRWAEFARAKYPELKYLHHIPNGGKRTKVEAARFRAGGVKSGIPDICLPVPRGGWHGLYIELKRKGNTTTRNQDDWLAFLDSQGYRVAICYSWSSASEIIIKYLEGVI